MSTKKKTAKKMGRPTIYSEAVADEICTRLYESEDGEIPESLRQICSDTRMPCITQVTKWLKDEDKKDFAAHYARARELRKDAFIDRIVKLSREALGHAKGAPGTGEAGARIQAIKMEIETLKWIISKEWRHEYGDKVDQTITAQVSEAITLDEESKKLIEKAGDIASKIEPPEYKN